MQLSGTSVYLRGCTGLKNHDFFHPNRATPVQRLFVVPPFSPIYFSDEELQYQTQNIHGVALL